jgi:hypothetical protein
MGCGMRFLRSYRFFAVPVLYRGRMETHWRRNMLLSTLILAILFVTCTAIAQDSPRDAIELYFQAHAFGNGDHIRQVFAPDAKIRSSVVQTYLLRPAPLRLVRGFPALRLLRKLRPRCRPSPTIAASPAPRRADDPSSRVLISNLCAFRRRALPLAILKTDHESCSRLGGRVVPQSTAHRPGPTFSIRGIEAHS